MTEDYVDWHSDDWHLSRASPDIANPLKPTAMTRNEMATARVCENPTTRSNVASMPKPVDDGRS